LIVEVDHPFQLSVNRRDEHRHEIYNAQTHLKTNKPTVMKHLMIENPGRYIESFAQAGSSWITVHAETCPHLKRIVKKIRQLKLRPGIVVKPATSLKSPFSSP
jgi:pentose-5-phosphate-3-epimerase